MVIHFVISAVKGMIDLSTHISQINGSFQAGIGRVVKDTNNLNGALSFALFLSMELSIGYKGAIII